jgi:hypothetical protein
MRARQRKGYDGNFESAHGGLLGRADEGATNNEGRMRIGTRVVRAGLPAPITVSH